MNGADRHGPGGSGGRNKRFLLADFEPAYLRLAREGGLGARVEAGLREPVSRRSRGPTGARSPADRVLSP